MNKILISLLLLFISVNVDAQFKELSSQQFYNSGDVEIGFSINIGKFSTKMNINRSSPDFVYFQNPIKEEDIYFHIGANAGYYILPGLSIEPELNINFSNDYSLAIIIGNLSYTFFTPLKNISPYIKLGYGFAGYNSEDFFDASNSEFDKYDIFNSSAGIKIKYSSTLFMKLEVNYRYLQTSGKAGYDPADIDISKNIISLSFGVSVLY